MNATKECAQVAQPGLPYTVDRAGVPIINWELAYAALGMISDCVLFEMEHPSATAPQPGRWAQPLIVGATPNRVIAAFRSLGVPVSVHQNPDLNVVNVWSNGRSRKSNSSVNHVSSFSNNVEADDDFKGYSANDLARRRISCITLEDRLMLGLGYFATTGRHLDESCCTLCAGSRYKDGTVPLVYFVRNIQRLYVSWCKPDISRVEWRARRKIACRNFL